MDVAMSRILLLAILAASCSSTSTQQISEQDIAASSGIAYLTVKLPKESKAEISPEKVEIEVHPLAAYENGTSFIGDPQTLGRVSFAPDQEYSISVIVYGKDGLQPVLASDSCGNRRAYYLAPGTNQYFVELCPASASIFGNLHR